MPVGNMSISRMLFVAFNAFLSRIIATSLATPTIEQLPFGTEFSNILYHSNPTTLP
jgi:hypothetical protein